MHSEELDLALNELEVRLDRLRALYEQYFIGIEKLEPTIARKDVERRFYVLRREKIRNTGRRFKLQTLIQRYNTFQQYWQRICREIENGTYRRHVIRAERKGPSELLTVATRRRFGKERERAAERSESEPPQAALDDAARSPSELPRASLETPTLPRGTRVPVLPPMASPPVAFAKQLDSSVPPQVSSVTRPAKSTPPKSYESLELDMDFMGDWEPSRTASKPVLSPKPKSPELVPRPAPAPVVAPPRRVPPPKPSRDAPADGAFEPPRRRPERPTNPGLAPPPPGTPRPPGVPAAATAAAPAKAPSAQSSLTEDRLRALHTRLNEASQKTNQPAVSLDGLARSLRAAETKLRTQHGNRRIDFEVILRDGKPVVKPIVR